jgi:VCBS repeat-containing protein
MSQSVSIQNTPQARDDSYFWNEDALFAASIFDAANNIARLNVMSNDSGGNAKKLFSIDNGDFLNDLLVNNVNTGWEATANGNMIRIHNGQIELDISNSLVATAGSDSLNALGAGMTIADSFSYAIQLGNGALSAATVTFTLEGDNDAATITADPGGDYDVATGESSFGFAPSVEHGTGQYSTDVAIADVNGDGNLDVLAVNHISGSISVFLNDGNGNLSGATNFPAAGPQTADGLTLAYMDGDTFLDIVTADATTQAVSVWLGNGDGSFDAPVSYGTGGVNSYINNVRTADFNADGKLDVVANVGGFAPNSGVSVLFGNGDGTLGAPTVYSNMPTVARTGAVAVGDMDGDNDVDIVTGGLDTGNIMLWLNDGSGTFSAGDVYLTGSNYPGGITVADLNNDSRLDIITANGSAATDVSVFLNLGGGNFAAPNVLSTGPGASPTDVAVADMNGDGFVDLVTSNSNSTASVLLGDGIGNFGTAQLIPINGVASSGVALGDLDEDGSIDVVVSNTTSNNISVLINDSDVTGADPNASGDLDISDVDFGEAKFAAVTAGDLEGTYGDFLFDTDTGEWSYELNNSDPDTVALAPGGSALDTLTAFSYDGSANYTITINVFGGASEFSF